MSLGTHCRLPVWLPIVSIAGSHAGDFEGLVHLVKPTLLLGVGTLGVHVQMIQTAPQVCSQLQ